MNVEIRGIKVNVDDNLREQTERRLGFALGKFGHSIDRVSVRYEDVNGLKGGQDKRCQIIVKLSPGSDVTVEQKDDELLASLNRCVDRTERAVRRELDRHREAPITRARRQPKMTIPEEEEEF